MDSLTKHTYRLLLRELNDLQIKAHVYCNMWGSESDEVKDLDSKIYDLNVKILDILNDNRGL